MTKKYQIVASYDSHIVVLETDTHFRDFSSTKIIEREYILPKKSPDNLNKMDEIL